LPALARTAPIASAGSPVPATTSAVLTVDLAVLAANYRALQAMAARAACAAVVKADAYGLGIERVAPALARAGCRSFFVAHAEEGLALRKILGPAAGISVLHGLPSGTEAECHAHDLTPVLNDDGQRAAWCALASRLERRLPAILQIDSGMARFGFSPDEAAACLDTGGFDGLDLRLVMSHLACADQPDDPANAAQRMVFDAFQARLSGVPASLAASSGTFLSADFHYDLIRPGAALYGIAPQPGRPNPMRPVVGLAARVMQVRQVPAGTAVGYGHTARVARDSRLATVAIGYADGFLRSASGRGEVWQDGHRLPILGRVSMDSIVIDATDAPPGAVAPGSWIEVVGPARSLDAVADAAGTIGYEVLTSLGHRFHRHYLDA